MKKNFIYYLFPLLFFNFSFLSSCAQKISETQLKKVEKLHNLCLSMSEESGAFCFSLYKEMNILGITTFKDKDLQRILEISCDKQYEKACNEIQFLKSIKVNARIRDRQSR